MGKGPENYLTEVPNEVTLAAMREAEEMDLYPEKYPRFNSVAEMIAALDADDDFADDPDFTKVTPDEAARITAAENSGFIADEDIDWDNLAQYAG